MEESQKYNTEEKMQVSEEYIQQSTTYVKVKTFRDVPGGPVVKNPPSSAGDVGSIPGWGTKIPRAAGQLSCTPQLQNPHTLEPTHRNY